MTAHFEFTLDDEQPMPTREEAIKEQKRLLRWALNDEAFYSAIVCEERQKFEKKYAHWKDLEKAEAEGRLVVLPCKVGDTIWRIKCSGEWPDVGKPYVEADAFLYRDIHYFGKTVFRTREEAEAALEGENNAD